MHLLTVAYNEAVDIVDTEKLVTAVSHYKYLYNNGHTRYKSKKSFICLGREWEYRY